MKVRKKPVVVDAWKVIDLLDIAKERPDAMPKAIHEAYLEGGIEFEAERIVVATLEGIMNAPVGWWIIRGVQGELYPCEATVFDQTYEPVEEPPALTGVVGPVPTAYDANPEG